MQANNNEYLNLCDNIEDPTDFDYAMQHIIRIAHDNDLPAIAIVDSPIHTYDIVINKALMSSDIFAAANFFCIKQGCLQDSLQAGIDHEHETPEPKLQVDFLKKQLEKKFTTLMELSDIHDTDYVFYTLIKSDEKHSFACYSSRALSNQRMFCFNQFAKARSFLQYAQSIADAVNKSGG